VKRSNAKKTIQLNVTVADITYSRRVVEFPSVCPNPECKADLTLPGAMEGLEYSAETRPMIIEGDCDVTYDEDNGPSCCDGNIGWLSVYCERCNQTLAAGEEKEITEVAAKAV